MLTNRIRRALKRIVPGRFRRPATSRAAVRLTVDGFIVWFDPGYYLDLYPDVAQSGMDPVRHYVEAGFRERRLPNLMEELRPFFDNAFYAREYPDVSQSSMTPLDHFAAYGLREGRRPNPFFWPDWYAEQYATYIPPSTPSVMHFLRVGLRTGFRPCPLFDPEFYARANHDVRIGGMNPVMHFVSAGRFENRCPHPIFSVGFYLDAYPDTAHYRGGAAEHFVVHGADEGRSPSPLFDSGYYRAVHMRDAPPGMTPQAHWLRTGLARSLPMRAEHDRRLFLPADATFASPRAPRRVAVIVPAYRGLAETRACVESVLASQNRTPFRFLVIDDCSPEPEVSEYLRAIGESGRAEVLRNETNLGFVATVNRGMGLHPDHDVILLNSDTEVHGDWLDRMTRQAYSDPRIGTVTPFSNSATICSYPSLEGTRSLPRGETTATIDAAAAGANAGRHVDLPTAVGFCMYIRRDCLDEIGYFDEAAFGRGYGEENDFCLRASAKGWRHLLAADVFVYHAGEVSFATDASDEKAKALRVVTDRYPDYLDRVRRHIALNPARPLRIALTAARFKASGQPVVLMITHALGGGTERYLRDIAGVLSDRARFLTIHPILAKPWHELYDRRIVLASTDPSDGFELIVDPDQEFDFLVDLLRSFNVSRVHIHHFVYLPLDVRRLVRALGLPFDFTVHDYFSICPRTNLIDVRHRYCGEPGLSACTRCIGDTGTPHGVKDIWQWRLVFQWLFAEADRVICPSADVARRLARYVSGRALRVVPHKDLGREPEPVSPAPLRLAKDEKIRVATLGVLAPHKGSRIVRECLRLARRHRRPVEFVTIGYVDDPEWKPLKSAAWRQTGRYEEADLPGLIADIDPHVLLFPNQWPETYSYTLSTALATGRPIVATTLGAVAERLAGRPLTRLVDWRGGAPAIMDALRSLRAEIETTAWRAAPEGASAPTTQESFYRKAYLDPGPPSPRPGLPDRPRDLRVPERTTIVAAIEMFGVYTGGLIRETPSPCGYIRGLLPLQSLPEEFSVYFVPPGELTSFIADAVFVQRAAVSRRSDTESLIVHCARHAMPLIYELDDLLFDIPETHDEYAKHEGRAAAAFQMFLHADQVWVSTEPLARRFHPFNANIHVIPNALDGNVWSPDFGPAEKRDRGGPARILYMGTRTHTNDLQIITPAAQELVQRFGDRVRFEVIGATDQRGSFDWCQFVEVPGHHADTYPAFVHWLMTSGRWDIGIAPLDAGTFNDCKSGIKFLDYAALGLASACSDVIPYRGIVRDGDNGLLVPNTPETWYGALARLIEDADLRARLAATARREFRERHTLDRLAGLRGDLIHQALADARSKRLRA